MIARLSWLAYLKIFIFGILFYLLSAMSVFSIVSAWTASFLGRTAGGIAFIFLSLLYLSGFVYYLVKTRRCMAFTDDDGVWFYSRIFPWSRGLRGVRWENFDQAQFRTGIFSWLCRSYTVYLLDRYGKTVMIKDLSDGRDWSASVNDAAAGLYRERRM